MKISAVEERLQRLTGLLREMDSAVLAYSGGLDSTFLLMALKLSGIRALAVTGLSPTTPAPDLEDARRMARSIGVEHRVIPTGEMEEPPGSRAARKHSVRSPLLEAGYSKDDIREASRELGLDTWLKPASACLSSRIPFGTPITSEALATVREAEGALREMGFAALRVRAHGPVALIEVPKERMAEALEAKEAIVERLRRAGFKFVGLDLAGLRSGSMNRLLE
ncbi:MAG: TIGR00268 family protein [Nitrospirota bacterium]